MILSLATQPDAAKGRSQAAEGPAAPVDAGGRGAQRCSEGPVGVSTRGGSGLGVFLCARPPGHGEAVALAVSASGGFPFGRSLSCRSGRFCPCPVLRAPVSRCPGASGVGAGWTLAWGCRVFPLCRGFARSRISGVVGRCQLTCEQPVLPSPFCAQPLGARAAPGPVPGCPELGSEGVCPSGLAVPSWLIWVARLGSGCASSGAQAVFPGGPAEVRREQPLGRFWWPWGGSGGPGWCGGPGAPFPVPPGAGGDCEGCELWLPGTQQCAEGLIRKPDRAAR